VARPSTCPDQRNSITQALATCEPHITPSCAGLWPPLLLNCSENKRRQRVQSSDCFVCSHGGLPLDAFIISLIDATVPWGDDVTARSMSNMKEGVVAAKNLWGEANSTRSVLRLEARRHHVANFPTRLHIRPVYYQPSIGPKAYGCRDSATCLRLCLCHSLSFLSNCLEHSQMDKALCEQREHYYPQYDAYCSEQLWKCQTGLRWEKCCEWDETADTSFPFIPSSEATFVAECFIYVLALSLVTCAFYPTSTAETQHVLSCKRLLVSHLFCLGSVLLVWTWTVWISPNLLFRGSSEGDTVIQMGWRFFCLSVLWLLSLLSLFFSPRNVNLMF